jgi:hypothetical protein
MKNFYRKIRGYKFDLKKPVFPAKITYYFDKIKGYGRFYDMLYSLRRYNNSEVAQQRLNITNFYEKYGEKATKEAFSADKKLISKWRKKLKENGGGLQALVPLSTRPHRVRCSNVVRDERVKQILIGG